MIRLRYFNQKDKETFLRQAESLIQQEFLNSFLILSLLVNIFKAENELPQTKVELSKLACPNNKDIDEEIILENLSRHYKGNSAALTELKLQLWSCSGFVPSARNSLFPRRRKGHTAFFTDRFLNIFMPNIPQD